MKNDEIQRLIDRYLNAETSLEEEKRLASLLLADDLPREWQAIKLMLGDLTMGEAEYDAILSQRKTAGRKHRWWAAAASLLVLCGIATATLHRLATAPSGPPSASVVGAKGQASVAPSSASSLAEPMLSAVTPQPSVAEPAPLKHALKAKTRKKGGRKSQASRLLLFANETIDEQLDRLNDDFEQMLLEEEFQQKDREFMARMAALEREAEEMLAQPYSVVKVNL
ncbi:MAG: hypothetical protein IJ196_01460 [Prevotella sp.]|nr:hypothetical protein [Prevotella sp.]